MAAHWSEVPKRAKEAGLSPEGKKSKKGGGGEAGATAEDAADEDEEMRPDKFSTDVTSLLGADGGPQLNKLYKYLLLACAKGVVRHERILRELQAASNIYVWKATEEHPLQKPLKKRYGEYIEEVKKIGKDHKLGGPQGMLLMELLELLTEEPGRATLTEEQKREASEYREEIRSLTSEEVMERCPLIKIQKAFSKKGGPKAIKIKICLYCSKTLQTCINMWLSANGATRLLGTPAPASTERDLVRMLSKIEEQEKK